jgi:hypothetical protein
VTGFWGLALSEMPHRLQVDALYGWCAWDTLFIPLILGKEAHVESPCATTGEIVSLTVGPDGVRDVAPDVDLVQAIARPYIYEENPRGTLGIVADRERDALVGAWAAAPSQPRGSTWQCSPSGPRFRSRSSRTRSRSFRPMPRAT